MSTMHDIFQLKVVLDLLVVGQNIRLGHAFQFRRRPLVDINGTSRIRSPRRLGTWGAEKQTMTPWKYLIKKKFKKSP